MKRDEETLEKLSGAGCPLPPLFSAIDEAVWWASIASEQEIEAFGLAAFLAMRPPRQSAFLQHVHSVRAQSRRPGWEPSARQVELLRHLLADLSADGVVIEDET